MARKKILLAEDDKDDQDFFHEFLHDRNDITLLPVAIDGVELIEYLEAGQTNVYKLPDAIILDQNMPKRNGLQALELLKGMEEYAHIPVMIYSTYVDDNLMVKSFGLGAAAVIAKPHDKEGYYKMIDELFKLIK